MRVEEGDDDQYTIFIETEIGGDTKIDVDEVIDIDAVEAQIEINYGAAVIITDIAVMIEQQDEYGPPGLIIPVAVIGGWLFITAIIAFVVKKCLNMVDLIFVVVSAANFASTVMVIFLILDYYFTTDDELALYVVIGIGACVIIPGVINIVCAFKNESCGEYMKFGTALLLIFSLDAHYVMKLVHGVPLPRLNGLLASSGISLSKPLLYIYISTGFIVIIYK